MEQIVHLPFAWDDEVTFLLEKTKVMFSRNSLRGEFSSETDLMHPCFYRDIAKCLQSLDL